MVQIVHSDGYQTMYLHLSRMFVHQGERVEIGKTIGLVGSSGLSTGPHLDFRILQRGQYKNFEKLGLPPSDPIAKEVLAIHLRAAGPPAYPMRWRGISLGNRSIEGRRGEPADTVTRR